MRSIKLLKIPLLLFGLKVFAQEEHKPIPDRVLQRSMQMRDQLLTYTTPLNPKENEIIPYYIQSNGQDYKILLIRYKGKVHAVSAICTYDLETDLSEGICFNNKLYCPKHGCQYDITNGWVENPPAIDNLAIFSVNETPDFLRIFAPSVVPVKLKPAQAFRDYNDMRKVAIYGNGAAAYGCLAGLRENGYSGEISLITSDTHIPYDKLKLTKQIKATQPEDFYFRPEDQYDGVEFLLGKSIQYINNKHSNTYVELDDGTRVAYDALILCNGTFPVHQKVFGLENQQNFYLNDLAQHQQLKERLKETKNLTVIGINLKSLETISTITQEYPKININLIDINKVNQLQAVYGPQVSDKLIDMAIENGVQVFEKAQLRYFTDNELEFYDGYKIQSDTVLMFPNNFSPDTEFTRRSRLFEYDNQGRISVDYNQRTLTKRIFAAGSVAQTLLPVTKQQHIGNQWTAAYNQGLTAAYNVLALNVPWHQVPFEYQELFGKVFQQVNTWTYYDTVHILGDIKKFDFVALYGANDYIIGAVGSQSNRMAVIAEALRVNRLPMLTDIVKNQVDFPKIDRAIRKYNKSACYRYPLYLHRDDYLEQDVIWSSREMFSTYINISDDPEILPSDVSPNPNDVKQLD